MKYKIMSSVRPLSTNNGLCSHLNFPSLLENDDRLSKRPLKDGADGWKMDGTDKMPVVQHIVQLGMKSIWWTASTLFLRRYCSVKRTWPSDLLAVSRNIDFLSHPKCIPQELTFHPKCIQLCRSWDLNFSESWQVGHLVGHLGKAILDFYICCLRSCAAIAMERWRWKNS